MMDHIAELLGLQSAFTAGLIALLWWFIKRDRKRVDDQFKGIDDRFDQYSTKLEEAVDENKEGVEANRQRILENERNYVRRFDAVHTAMSQQTAEIAGKIHELELSLVKELRACQLERSHVAKEIASAIKEQRERKRDDG
jgi:hypothetical protein